MKCILLGGLLLIAANSFSQSKKKQIEILQHQLDSISDANLMLAKTAEEQIESVRLSIKKLNKENEVLREIMKGYIYQIDELNAQNIELRAENDALSNKINQGKDAEPKRRQHEPSDRVESGLTQSSDPFFDGGEESSNFDIFSNGMGSGEGTSKSARSERIRTTQLKIDHIEVDQTTKLSYWLWIDWKGNVIRFECLQSKTTTTDQGIINRIGHEIGKQVKYNKVESPHREKVLFHVVINGK
ncbi:MAG: hypothetical protein AB8B56_01200 [Crocinitomicaceae bacterium]